MTTYLSLLVGLIGLVMYAASNSGKIQEIGRIAYFCGLLVFLFQIGLRMVKLP